ncbi:RAI1-domain-containing protein [Pleomassaria siparia CBS 279.74]|uniref:Decapping nuclease n=1 Tax=Pleomassaria siparia CBS 279.74 TaxID=1314801 RepID=A0A6G1KRM0_9PLEO|nr:RAI1-domain-containing protein [Pleomassaria siparia CBS 279.74]
MSQPSDRTSSNPPHPSSLPPKPTAPMPGSPNSNTPSPPRKRPRTHAPNSRPTTSEPTPSASSISHSTPTLFPIQPHHRFQGSSARIKRPIEVAHFSYDDNHEYLEDESGINYYHPPHIGADLKDGFETFRHYEDKEDPHLDSLLKTLMLKEKRGETRVQADFVTWRGMMTKILTAPFDFFAQFDMYATLHEGTIYIEEDFAAKAADRSSQSSQQPPSRNQYYTPNPNQPTYEMMTFWGYKFEVLSLLPNPPLETPQSVIAARPQAPVSNYAQHCSIVRTAFGDSSLILGGEVDGLWGPKPTDPDAPIPWIELKTSEELPYNRSKHDVLKFERKLLKFWAQSFLLGVGKVIVGFRSKAGILRAVEVYETGQIPGMVRRGTQCWDGNTCINFASALLSHLKETITDEGVYRITLRKKGGAVEVQKVQEKGTGAILSEEFLEWRAKGKAGAEKDENKVVSENLPAGGVSVAAT